jgi:uncharacterized membrane protein (UPF0127 family)
MTLRAYAPLRAARGGWRPPDILTGMAWLVREGDVLASVDVARGPRERTVGLLGRDPESVTGAFVLRPCRQIHTLGMRFPIDVAFCDRQGVVLRTLTVRPWRVSRVVWRSGFVVEAAAGSFERWHLRAGDTIEVKE